jgi:hypothetical protein
VSAPSENGEILALTAPEPFAARAPDQEISSNSEQHQADDPKDGEEEKKNHSTSEHDETREEESGTVLLRPFAAARRAPHQESLRNRAVKWRRNGA